MERKEGKMKRVKLIIILIGVLLFLPKITFAQEAILNGSEKNDLEKLKNYIVFETLNEKEKKRLSSLYRRDPQKFKKVIKEKLKQRKQYLRKLYKEDPEKFRKVIREARKRIRNRIERLRRENPQKFHRLIEKRRKLRRERFRRWCQDNPQKCERLLRKRKYFLRRKRQKNFPDRMFPRDFKGRKERGFGFKKK